MTAQQITDLKTLQATSGIRDLQLAANWANDASKSGSITSTTAPNVVSVHDLWTQQRISNAKAVLTGAGITRSEVTTCDAASIATKVTTWINAQTAAQRPLFTIKAGAFFALLFDRLADTNLDANESATQDIGSLPVYGNSWSEQKGFGVNGVTRDLLEQALRTP